MNKDQIKGRVEEAKGNVKEVTGKLLDNDDMELEGSKKTLAKSKQALAISRMTLRKASNPFIAEPYLWIQIALATAGRQSAKDKNLSSDI